MDAVSSAAIWTRAISPSMVLIAGKVGGRARLLQIEQPTSRALLRRFRRVRVRLSEDSPDMLDHPIADCFIVMRQIELREVCAYRRRATTVYRDEKSRRP
jgi:hypothetical protein